MTPRALPIADVDPGRLSPHLEALGRLYTAMDAAYAEAAGAAGFTCQGCEDNCCETEFHHHTLIEYLYIRTGFEALPVAARSSTLQAAASVRQYRQAAGEQPIRRMCPLNADGLCQIYRFRPMICRLHGIPSTFHHPVRGPVHSPGCGAYDSYGGGSEARLDRTPFYREMARLEQAIRQRTRISERVRMTVADMIVTFDAANRVPISCGASSEVVPP